MRYMGSKASIARHIIPIMEQNGLKKRDYVEPFVGGGNFIAGVKAKSRHGNDIDCDVIATLKAVSTGWVPPTRLSYDLYKAIKDGPELYDSAIVGFAAFSCSYAGKKWGGYARGNDFRGNPRNFADEQSRALVLQGEKLYGTTFSCLPYDKLDIKDDSIVYCDPPYAGTTKYKTGFDHDKFWGWAKELSKRCTVFVSEYTAPDWAKVIWEKSVTSSLTRNTGGKTATEKLYKLNG